MNRTKFICSVLTLGFMAVFNYCVFAKTYAESEILRVPSKETLFGYWEKMPTPEIVSDNFPPDLTAPYQWLALDSDGKYAHFISDKFQNYSARSLRSVFEKLFNQDNEFKYTNGYLLVNDLKEQKQQIWQVSEVIKKGEIQGFKVRPGDLLLVQVDGAALRQHVMTPLAVKHLRKHKRKPRESDVLEG